MHSYTYFWLAGFVGLTALHYVCKEPLKKWAANALLLFATIFVVFAFSAVFANHAERLTRSVPTVGADQAELMLKINDAISYLYQFAGRPQSSTRQNDFVKGAEKTLRELASKQPDNALLAAKEVIVCHEARDPIAEPLARLAKMKNPEAQRLYEAFSTIYAGRSGLRKLQSGGPDAFEVTFKDTFPPGWYRDVALMELYGASVQSSKLEAVRAQFDKQCLFTCYKVFGISIVVGLAMFVGVIVILAQLFFLPRTLTTPESVKLVQAPADYGVRAVLGVFIGWLAAQNLVALLLPPQVKEATMLKDGALVAALSTALIYLVTIAPALIFIWLFAFRPNKVNYFEGIKLRLRVGNLGPVSLVLTGILTWFAALPIVAVAYMIAVRFLGSQGSSNPIIGLVMEASRTANFPVTIVIFFTLGVMAPICEESIFRGFLYTYLRRKWGVFVSIFLSALVFAGVHLDAGGFLPLFSLGMIFGFVFERTKSIIPSMIAHGMWNSGTFLLILLLFGS